MGIAPIYTRVIGLDVHQAKISACAVIGTGLWPLP